MTSPGHTRNQLSTTSIATASSTGQFDDYLTVPTHYDYGSDTSSYGYSSPGDSPAGDISPDQSFSLEGGVQVRRSQSTSSVGTGTGRRARHVSQACDSCKTKKTKCDGANPCSVCEKNGWNCTTTSKDNRKTPNKAYVASLERQADHLRKHNQLLDKAFKDMKARVTAYEEKLKAAGLTGAGGSGSGSGMTAKAEGLTIVIPKGKAREDTPAGVDGDGDGQELLGMGEKLVRDRSGSLTAYAGPSPLAHLATSPPPPAPPSPPLVPDPQAPRLGWSSITIPAPIQMQAVDNFFMLSGTELLPLHALTLSLLQQGLTPGSPLPPSAQPIELTPALYNALLANALSFLPPLNPPIPPSTIQHFAQAAGDLQGIFGHQGMGNVLGLGLLAQCCAGAGSFDVGWQYAGMSARMMQSLGLHLDASRRERDIAWASLSPQEKKMRNIVYWIVYIQDKLWSMWVGRATAVTDNPDVPLPLAEGETHEPSLVFRAYCQLMRVAGRVVPSVYGAERTDDPSVIDAHRLALDAWLNALPDLLQPTPKAMETASLSLRHLHLVYHWLRILLDRPFYRQITQQLAQETGVTRTDASLRAIMHLLAPWDRQRAGQYGYGYQSTSPGGMQVQMQGQIQQQPHLPSPVPLTPLLAQIVLSTGITWLQSAVAFHKFSKKRKDEGVAQARVCLRLLHDAGHRSFSSMLRRLMRKYFSSLDVPEPGVRGLNAGMSGLGINTGAGGISVPVLPQVQMSPPAEADGFSPSAHAQTLFSSEPASFGHEPGNTNMSLAMNTLSSFPPDLLSPPYPSPGSVSPAVSGLHTPSNGYAPLPMPVPMPGMGMAGGTLGPNGWTGPDTEMMEMMSEYLTNWNPDDGASGSGGSGGGAAGESGPSSANPAGRSSGFVPEWIQQQQRAQQQQMQMHHMQQMQMQQQQQQQQQRSAAYGVYQEPEDYAMDSGTGGAGVELRLGPDGLGQEGDDDGSSAAALFRERYGQKTVVPLPGSQQAQAQAGAGVRGVSPGNMWA